MTMHSPDFSGDLLLGAGAIAEFLFGDKKHRRKVYHLAATSNVPIIRLGSKLCARESVLKKWIKEQEGKKWIKPSTDDDEEDEDD